MSELMALSIKVLGTVLGLKSQVQNRPYLLLLIKAARFVLNSSVCQFLAQAKSSRRKVNNK